MKQEYDFSKGVRGRFFRENAKPRIPTYDEKLDWVGPKGPLGVFVVNETKKTLKAYREQPLNVLENANEEQSTAHGGYAHRQLFELVQNSADALLDAPNGKSILIRLTKDFLYCADDGKPIDKAGIVGILFSRMSSKRNTPAIGRHGLGFKSVLCVTDAPEFYSRSASFRFDKNRAAERIAEVTQDTQIERYPVLRLPEPIDPRGEMETDEELRELMAWATNIVRLPLKSGAHSDLVQQIQGFPPEFMLFVDHVHYLTLEDGERSRDFMLHHRDGKLCLEAEDKISHWLRFGTTHRLSDEAKSDWPLRDDSDEVSVQWAVPLDRLDRPGHFWAFFPTSTASLVAGILNAPWKTNEDRQNLLPGPYNDELIKAAAGMIAKELPNLSTNEDPARHLDALPRRHQGGDSEQADFIRERLFSYLDGSEIVPDQDGNLHTIADISYPPKRLTDSSDKVPLERWATYSGRPPDWLHNKALTRKRLASIDRLFPTEKVWIYNGWADCGWRDRDPSAPRATIAKWLRALIEGNKEDDAVKSSMEAIQIAAAIPSELRSKECFGDIVLTENGSWQSLDPDRIFLPDETQGHSGSKATESYVHSKLASDRDTLSALKELGIKPLSPESRFKYVAECVIQSDSDQETCGDLHSEFWMASRELSIGDASAIIRDYKDYGGWEKWSRKLRVRTCAGTWQSLHSVLLPGEIVPGDGNDDDDATVDMDFHEPDENLLRCLGVNNVPHDGCELSAEPFFKKHLDECRDRFTDRSLKNKPQLNYLIFKSNLGCGPLHVLTRLSEEGRVAYTRALLSQDSTFSEWTMRHKTRDIYPELACQSLSISVLREEGRIRTSSGAIVPFSDALGQIPKNPEALHALLTHPMAEKIKDAFDLVEPPPEFFGEGDPVPLTDIWPGLNEYVLDHRKQCCLVSCERILLVGESRECVFSQPNIYIVGAVDDDEQRKLSLVSDELGLNLSAQDISKIVQHETPTEIKNRRAAIRQCSTDAERLLAAVGEQKLRKQLPDSLLAVIEENATLTGIEVAEAAIATYHTDALKRYKWALSRFCPPARWAGSAKAIDFVQSLGFSPEWAGERTSPLEPFLEIEGRYQLPELHCYQKVIVNNLRKMLDGSHSGKASRRGMISMPTGSGKTRVAVQGIVEAMRDDGFVGGVLWVADRRELCEQAMEAWCRVWSSIGPHESQLRISRMWAGLQPPTPMRELHIIVATIQTLHAKLSNRNCDYDFLKDFKLIVFDEAHRSLSPTSTSVMAEIGLTRRKKEDEPFLLGLTATPYRGYNEEETGWLANRYGGNRLDDGAWESGDAQEIIQSLQSDGVLAHADHEIIEGETFSLDDVLEGSSDSDAWRQEVEKWQELPWLPQSVENRIAQSAKRTKRILDAYGEHIAQDWPTLIFATSVEHAQTVAALLNQRGIRSRAVSGETETATRRRVVEEFRSGKIKALVNYGVFREGFDAPKTRAIIVARPVYSPNLYFQMIGRGLRGPLNGGDDRCLILNVQDNIENFDRSLAFSDLDWLWA